MRRLLFILVLLPLMAQTQTLEECRQVAERNYPLIRRYGLIERTTELTVANISKAWLPQVNVTAQATLQSDVTAFPEQMEQLYRQMGISMEKLERFRPRSLGQALRVSGVTPVDVQLMSVLLRRR